MKKSLFPFLWIMFFLASTGPSWSQVPPCANDAPDFTIDTVDHNQKIVYFTIKSQYALTAAVTFYLSSGGNTTSRSKTFDFSTT